MSTMNTNYAEYQNVASLAYGDQIHSFWILKQEF